MDAATMAIAVGSSGNSGLGSSSSSSASSSGYGSATTTPTTPGQYEATAAAPTPMATIATVAPFYSEALTSLDAQHRQQQQQLQHQYQHQHQQHQQQHQQQQQQTHYYHQNYNYGSNMSLDAYNYSAYNYNVPSARYEKLAKYNNNSNTLHSSSNNISSNSSKPQAAATPFYAQPTQSMPMTNPYDAYKYKLASQQQSLSVPQQQQQHAQQQYHQLGMGMGMNMGVGMGMGMSMNMGMTAAQKQQQQQQQLQQQQQQQSQQQQLLPPLEPNYAAIKPSSRYQNMPASVYGGMGGGAGAVGPGVGTGVATGVGAVNGTTVQGNASAYYDKYAMSLYTPNAPLGFAAPAPLYSPPELGADPAYRKSGNASCHWSVDNGNSPAIYQYGNATNVANSSAVTAGNELYYKYDKYGTAAAYQTNLTQPYAGRGLWSGANPVENSSSNGRQSCCTQAYAPQSCYYSRGNGYDTVAPPTAQYAGGSSNNGSHNSSSNTASSLMNHKLHKHPTDLYANYELGPSQRPYAYAQNTPTTPSNSQRYVAPMSLSMGMEASVSTAYYDLSPLDGYSQQVALSTHRNQPPLEYQYRKRALPAPAMAPNNCYLGNLETHVDQFGSGYATPSPTTLKSSSNSSNIRDFLASWNDDEEEVTAPQAVAVVAPTPAPTAANSSFMYETLAPAGPVATAVLDAQVSELNLPDIIIDHHEKAVGNLAPNVPHVEDSFGSFDVEKELDELRLKKGTGDQVTGDNDALAEILREPEVAPPPQLPQQETSPPTPLTSPNPAGTEPQTSIEFDQQTSNNSNESTFEKEYETFIHSELSAPVDTELREHDKFKFYKRKRKTTEPSSTQELEQVIPVESISKSPVVKPSARSSRKLLARRRRNRLKMLQILEFESPKIKHRYYFLTLKLLHRRFAQSQGREQRLKRMRRQLALRKERHLPLIKRQSAMQYAQEQQGEEEQQGQLPNPSSPIETQAKMKTASSSGRETVIKSVSAVREKLDVALDKQQESTELCIPVPEGEEHSLDSNHSRSLKSVELLGSFKGFDDVENTNLSPRAKLRVEETEEKVKKEELEEQNEQEVKQEECKELGKVAAKQLEIQRWLSNSMEEQSLSKTQAETVICLSSGSSSASSSSSSSSSGSSSSDSDSSSSSSGEEDKDGASSSSSSSEASEFNELAALQKELSQQPEQVSKPSSDTPAETLTIPEDTPEKVSNKDIAKLKQILESDGDEELPPSPGPERVQCSSVPKLSDLSKIALNSSLKISDCPTEGLNPLEAPPRELSVEEALAEMYQQIGVASDPEDCEVEAVARKDMEESTAGQDVLINLAEIFDNNSSDLYVVQCDLNENILGVVNGEQNELQQQQQLIELLAQPEIESVPVEAPEIHHEEIVPPEKCKILERRRQLLKYLHAKYVQSHIGRYYHAQRVLKKYKRIPCKSKCRRSLSSKFKH